MIISYSDSEVFVSNPPLVAFFYKLPSYFLSHPAPCSVWTIITSTCTFNLQQLIHMNQTKHCVLYKSSKVLLADNNIIIYYCIIVCFNVSQHGGVYYYYHFSVLRLTTITTWILLAASSSTTVFFNIFGEIKCITQVCSKKATYQVDNASYSSELFCLCVRPLIFPVEHK